MASPLQDVVAQKILSHGHSGDPSRKAKLLERPAFRVADGPFEADFQAISRVFTRFLCHFGRLEHSERGISPAHRSFWKAEGGQEAVARDRQGASAS